MLEAVNSVLQNAPLARANNEQVSTVDSYAGNPNREQRAAPKAPYISPYIHLDVNYDKAVIQLRNGETGDVIEQFPSEANLKAEARQAAKRRVASEQASAPQKQEESAQAYVQQNSPAAESQRAALTAQQQAAFQAAAQSGNSNAGNVTLFA